jgi:hypothetical protein
MEDKIVNRGYVRWTDDDGVFHKEPLYDHPDLLAKASPAEQLAAEEARRLNASAQEYYDSQEDNAEKDAVDTLKALKAAPEEILTSAELVADQDIPDDQDESPEVATMKRSADDATADPEHDDALAELRENTADLA